MTHTILNCFGNGCLVLTSIACPGECEEGQIIRMGIVYIAANAEAAAEAAAAERVARHPLTSAKLKRLAERYKPPAEWQGDADLL